MIRIQAEYDGEIEVGVGSERLREFLNDARNFVELMPGVESITAGANDTRRWTIRADVPLLGSMRAVFPVEQTDDGAERIEWSPVSDERKNFLRYAATLEPRGADRTLVRITQRVEMRREKASELHTLAGWIGERRISAEMTRRIGEMMKTFLESARQNLER